MPPEPNPHAAQPAAESKRAPQVHDALARGAFKPLLAVRAILAGWLMGIANLIPGVSGGTMILALGLYEEFINSVAELTALRFSVRRVVFLGLVAAAAASAIFLLAGLILYLLFHHTAAMLALFIGLTLGGAPLLWRELHPLRADAWISIAIGLGAMIALNFAKQGGWPQNAAMDLVSGVVGATTMVLPGVSGSYVLLLIDQYDRVVGAIDDLKQALRGADRSLLTSALWIVTRVGVGAVVGIVLLSNLLKWLLRRHHRATVGVLLGILVGAVFGLWPFGRAPSEKALERRSLQELRVFAARWEVPDVAGYAAVEPLAAHIAEHWNERGVRTVSTREIGIALVMIVAGFATTFALARLGTRKEAPPAPNNAAQQA